MPISPPTLIGTAGVTGSAGNSISMTTTEAVPAGNSVFLGVLQSSQRSIQPREIVSVTDGQGNNYEVDKMEWYSGSSPGHAWILSAHNVDAIPLGSTITVTFDISDNQMRWVGGCHTSGANKLDQAISATFAATPWAIGPTGSLASSEELAICFATSSFPSSGSVPTDGFTELLDQSAAGVDRAVMQYKIVATNDPVSSGGSSSTATVALLTTYRWIDPALFNVTHKTKVGGVFVTKPIKVMDSGVFSSEKPDKLRVNGDFL